MAESVKKSVSKKADTSIRTSKKRRVKSPETFRERAEKAASASSKPKRSKRLTGGAKKAINPFSSAVGRGYNSKPLKPFKKVLGVLGRIVFPKYFRRSWQELRLVTWPNLTESRRLTFAVIVFAIVFGASIAVVDWVLNKGFEQLLLK